MSIGTSVQTDNRKVEAIVGAKDLSIALCRSSGSQSSRTDGKCIEKFTPRYHHLFLLTTPAIAGRTRSTRNPSIYQCLLETIHADPRGLFGCASSVPMCFEAQSVVEAIAMQGLQLSHPINHATTDRSPAVFVVRLELYVLAMAMPDAVFRQHTISGRVWCACQGCSVSRIPVQHEVLVRNRLQKSRRLLARCRVA